MKRYISTACALAAAMSLFAQKYQVVVTTTDGERKVFATDDVASVKFKNAPEYKAAKTFIEGVYSPITDNALYTFTIGTETPDAEGQPAEVGGFQLSLALYAPLSAEAQNAKLPEGYYRVGSGNGNYTINASNSAMWVRLAEGEDGVTVSMVVGGTVDVQYDSYNYDVHAELDLLDGSHVDISYYGTMKFTVGASGTTDFDTDQSVSFTEAQGRVWANWFNPFSDDAALEFFTGSFSSTGAQTEGYYLYLPVYMNKDESRTAQWPAAIPDGVYKIDPRDRITGQTYLPNTLLKGAKMDLFGSATAYGSYLTYLEADGRVSMATLSDGTMTVSENGTKFDFDFTSSNNVKVTGSYSGKPNITNRIDNSSKPEFPDGLTADYEINKFPSDGVVIDYNMGDYIVSGLNSHFLMFTDLEKKEGDYIAIEVFSDSEKVKDGVYAIDNTFADMSGVKGAVSYQGEMVYSWYGDLDSTDSEGYQTILAPVNGGTLTVSTLSDGQRKFDFNLVDLKGNKITGSITRDVHYASDSDTNAAKVERSRARVGQRMQRNWSKPNVETPSRVLMLRK